MLRSIQPHRFAVPYHGPQMATLINAASTNSQRSVNLSRECELEGVVVRRMR